MAQLFSLRESANQPVKTVGGKAHALGKLIEFGAPVPPGFVVPSDIDLNDEKENLLSAFAALSAQFVAVRSSATGEDSRDQSWAGQFESFLCVSGSDLIGRIADCRDSLISARAKAYDDADVTMAVLVQAMIPSDVSGVLFTANPVTNDRNEIIVEAVYGLGEQLVQGLATPDRFVLDAAGVIKTSSIATKNTELTGSGRGIAARAVPATLQNKPALSHGQCQEVARLANRLEVSFGYPLDIEFAYHNNQLYIVQARPITTFS
jgi:phosphoenolpyruvate synthase/pyruvate phosphate dikinase